MDKIKLLTRLSIGLALLNVALLAFLFFPRMHRPFPPHNSTGDFLMHELKMNPSQREVFNQQRQSHHAIVDSLELEMQKIRSKLYGNNSMVDSASISHIAIIQGQIEQVTFLHFKEVRAALNPDQQAKFDTIIQEAVQKLQAQPHKPEHN